MATQCLIQSTNSITFDQLDGKNNGLRWCVRLLRRSLIEGMQACSLSWRNQKQHRYVLYNANYFTIWNKSSRHLLCNQTTSSSTCCLAQARHLSIRSFVVSWHSTWAQDLRMSKMHFSCELRCVLSTLTYLGWHRTTYLFLVCQFAYQFVIGLIFF